MERLIVGLVIGFVCVSGFAKESTSEKCEGLSGLAGNFMESRQDGQSLDFWLMYIDGVTSGDTSKDGIAVRKASIKVLKKAYTYDIVSPSKKQSIISAYQNRVRSECIKHPSRYYLD